MMQHQQHPASSSGGSSGMNARGRRLLPLALGLTALAAAASVAEGFVTPLPPCSASSSSTSRRPPAAAELQQPAATALRAPSSSSGSSSSTRLWARRRRKGDDADFERFNLDELRDESRFAPAEEGVDPEVFRPSKMEYYVPPPLDEMEAWDVTDTRWVGGVRWIGVCVCV